MIFGTIFKLSRIVLRFLIPGLVSSGFVVCFCITVIRLGT